MPDQPRHLRLFSTATLAGACVFVATTVLHHSPSAYAQVSTFTPIPTSMVTATSSQTSSQLVSSTPTPSRTPSVNPTVNPLQCTSIGWSVAADPFPDVAPHVRIPLVQDVAVVTSDDVWAVGRDLTLGFNTSQALISHWNGAIWSSVPNPSPDPFVAGLVAVAASAPNNVWAVGSYGSEYPRHALIERWNGTSWSLIPGPDLDHVQLDDVEVLAPDDVWTVGYFSDEGNGSGALILHWDGTSWTRYTVPTYELLAVAAAAPNDVWAVSSSIFHWDGTSWTEFPSPNTGGNGLNDIAVIAPDDIWSVGWFYTFCAPDCSTFAPTINHWDGQQWRAVPHPAPMNIKLESVTASGPNDVWAVGYGPLLSNHMLLLHWNGIQWSDVTPPLRRYAEQLTTIRSVGPNDMWSFGLYNQDGYVSHPLTLRYAELPAFTDVPHGSAFYQQVQCLSCRGVISGYACGAPNEPCATYNAPYFRPSSQVTRGQLAKIVSNAANFAEDPGTQIFEDVAPADTFYEWINRLTRRGYISGYACGGSGEPCVNGDRPYFRPGANATRGQTSKIVSNAARYNETTTGQAFEDVPPSYPFYDWIQRLASHGAMGGYICGGPGEPCGQGNRPYFRPYSNVTRGQSAKIIANTFYPDCRNPVMGYR